MKKLVPVEIPPHFQYFCIDCKQDFSTTERVPFMVPRGDPMQGYRCFRCANAENSRVAAE